jgi:hypothetical protein
MSSPSVQPGILSVAVGAAACASGATGPPKPPTPPEDRYRFYQCVFDPQMPQHVMCKAINKSQVHDTVVGTNSQLIAIENWMPSVADRAIIRFRLFEKRKLDFE